MNLYIVNMIVSSLPSKRRQRKISTCDFSLSIHQHFRANKIIFSKTDRPSREKYVTYCIRRKDWILEITLYRNDVTFSMKFKNEEAIGDHIGSSCLEFIPSCPGKNSMIRLILAENRKEKNMFSSLKDVSN
jgi:hypothetical protein